MNNKHNPNQRLPDDDAILPVPFADYLPVPLDIGPEHEAAVSRFPDWKNLAHMRHVRDVARCGRTGDLWLATNGGVLRWYPDFRRFTQYSSEHGLPGNNIAGILADGLGNVYCAPDYGGLFVFRDDEWLRLGDAAHETLSIRCMADAGDGRILIGTKDGLYKVEDSIISLYIPFSSVEPPRSIAITDTGDVWACYSLGLYLFREGKGYSPIGKQPTLLSLACSGKDLWIGKMDGLVIINLETGEPDQKESWPMGAITAILPMPEGLYLVCGNDFLRLSESGWERLLSAGGHWRLTGLFRWRLLVSVREIAFCGLGRRVG